MALGNNNFRSVIKTFKNHAPTILHYFRRRATNASAEAERKAIAKREAAKEKARKKAEEKKRIEDEKNRLIWPFLVQFVDDIKSGARKIGSDDYAPGT